MRTARIKREQNVNNKLTWSYGLNGKKITKNIYPLTTAIALKKIHFVPGFQSQKVSVEIGEAGREILKMASSLVQTWVKGQSKLLLKFALGQ